MGRIRTLKPGFFRSESLSRCSLEARITFAGLWTEADDHGRGDATARLLATALWPWDNPTDDQVRSWLRELAETEHIALYEHRGRPIFQVLRWSEHQSAAYRRGTTNFPAPPETTPSDTPSHDSARPDVQESAGTEQNRTDGMGEDVGGEQTGLTPSAATPDEVVSQSVDIYAEWVYAVDPTKCRQIPSRYKAGIAKNALTNHGTELHRHLARNPSATPADLARDVLGVKGIGGPPPKPYAPAWHADPDCPRCAGDGLTNMAEEHEPAVYAPCPCRRAEPYPTTTTEDSTA